MKKITQEEKLFSLIESRGVLRASDVVEAGIDDKAPSRLVEQGKIERVACGVYILAGLEPFARLVELTVAAVRVPLGVVCLLSALVFSLADYTGAREESGWQWTGDQM